ncbi:MAG: NTP transferase domain-containing protein [Bacteroidota bacterium]
MQLNALILIGGKSTRMGVDKSSIQYRDKTHRAYLGDLLAELGCEKVYFSCSKVQSKMVDLEYPILVDHYDNVGPIGGVLTAFEYLPDTAWLVVGCDYALLDQELLQTLIGNRRQDLEATVFRHPKSQLLEPLVSIYEAKAFPKIKAAFQNKQRSLRRILETLEINGLDLKAPHKLLNVNTPQEKENALKHLENRL